MSSLDPLEGLYDVDWTNHIIYKNGSENHSPSSYTCAIIKKDKFFYFYVPYNRTLSPQAWLIMEKIGSTPLYNFIMLAESNSSQKYIVNKQRVVFEKDIIWNYVHNYTQEEIRYDGSENLFKHVTREISAIKTYPAPTNVSPNNVASWSGTGFALNNGYIITNQHVVNGATTISVFGIKGDFSVCYNAEVVTTDKANDLAIIRINDSNFHSFGSIPYAIKYFSADVGTNIFVLGYPLTSTMGEEIKLTNGIISSKTGFQGDVTTYQISAPIQPGNSGGPLFDDKGNIIGIVNSKHTEAENVGYAIKTSCLTNLLDASNINNTSPTSNTISNLPLSEKIKKIKNFVFLIKCK